MSADESSAQPHDIHVVFPSNAVREQLSALAANILARRDEILEAWRQAGEVSQERNIASSLSRVQFNDHIPGLLDCFAHTIQEMPESSDCADLEEVKACEHGLQRWQQGYQLRELVREWGYLQISVGDELERYAAAHPSLHQNVMPAARKAWAQLCADGITESATQYWRLHQAESAGHVSDLENALAALHALEQSRAEGWRNAAHDLRGSVTVVKGATTLLQGEGSSLPEPLRGEVAEMLRTSVSSLNEMLNDLLSLARLEAGHEQREVGSFDAAVLLRDFCTASQTMATDHGLFLKMDGPGTLLVEGDRTKVLRILQNLLLNAVKYTQRGGVSVTWAIDTTHGMDRWTFSVQDTGPGIDENTEAPLAQELLNATTVAEEAKDASDHRSDLAPAKTLPSASETRPPSQQPGEGVGLSIVKRLCELLDASLELATEPGRGSTFRVILPRSYGNPAPR